MGLITNHVDFNFVQIFGVLLLVLAFFVWFVPFVEIKSNELLLSEAYNPNFDSSQVPMFAGSLRWWKNLYVSTIIPLIGILLTSGLVTLIVPFIFDFKHIGFLKRFRNKYQITTLDDYFKTEDR